MLEVWQKNLDKVVIENPQHFKAKKAFSLLLGWVHQKNYKAACHDTSAVLFILLSEIGYSCELKIGEVELPAGLVTDHSWVECNHNIYDIAISKQRYSQHSHAPIFQGSALDGNRDPTCNYGVKAEGLGSEAELVLGSTLIEYCKIHPYGVDFVFKLASNTLKDVGVRVSYMKLKKKYSNVTRELVVNV